MFWQFLAKVYDAQNGGCGLFIIAVLVICFAALAVYLLFDFLRKWVTRESAPTPSTALVKPKTESALPKGCVISDAPGKPKYC